MASFGISPREHNARIRERREAFSRELAAQLAKVPPRTYKVDGCPACEQPGAPAHQASEFCRSGRREHCSCDTCF